MGFMDKIKGAFKTSGQPGKSRERPPKPPEVRRRRKAGVRGFVYEPAITGISIDLKSGKVMIRGR